MKKLFIAGIIACMSACSQPDSGNIKKEINNTKTAKHIHIPGTRMYIISPPGFKTAAVFTGLEKDDYAGINVMDMPGGNFASNTATFTKQAFEQKGIKVFDYREMRINGLPAKFIHVEGADGARHYNLVFGDSSFSTMVTGTYPAGDAKTGKAIVGALNSIWYDKNKEIDPFETAHFVLDNSGSAFKFARYTANLYVYTINGKISEGENDDPVILVLQMPATPGASATSAGEAMLKKTAEYGIKNTVLKNVSTAGLNGHDAYQAEVYGQMKDKKGMLYLCAVTNGEISVVIQAIAKDNLDSNLAQFKQLASTIRLK